ncbi:SWIM zinc finger protein [Colletotrichum graminicola]|uniref:SWIM zinc finger protein n=1 Tax=Colletotrichum graminicola (strain M1.001 / M2 / FGSC 10212) TaxID=645133 RepID=E3QFJ0_COLGM|nr:SWIM zinc finger protein [Colletotrichum graminicola M1.001]EFQ29628.1 SWIM zinc finger protein [Colletotrichum graminicola M1.001]WDK23620.1 SWIM zinc finger protein [Colletotrichum graminicola]
MVGTRARNRATRSVSGRRQRLQRSTTGAASTAVRKPVASSSRKRKASLTDDISPPDSTDKAKKRKASLADDISQSDSTDKAKTPKTAVATAKKERRLRRYRPTAPESFREIYRRALTQRFYILDRYRCGTADIPEEEVQLTGSTGNIYTVHICQKPSCTCPHWLKGNQCKHWLYVMSRVLRAKYELTYQLALVPSELREIFANAPPIDASSEGSQDKNRKPVEGDCPICFSEFETGSDETIVWCRAACGQNIHKDCFETWAATKTKRRGSGAGDVTCPFCRSIWQGDDDMVKRIKGGGKITHEGYVNVADELGISPYRGKIA